MSSFVRSTTSIPSHSAPPATSIPVWRPLSFYHTYHLCSSGSELLSLWYLFENNSIVDLYFSRLSRSSRAYRERSTTKLQRPIDRPPRYLIFRRLTQSPKQYDISTLHIRNNQHHAADVAATISGRLLSTPLVRYLRRHTGSRDGLR